MVVHDFDRALAMAQQADLATVKGNNQGQLHGVPITVKETYDVAGLATTWGDPAAKSNIASDDAVIVARLKAAGAVLLGKTNVPLYAGDFQSYNAIYGQTNNPWDLLRSPGGSSGGGAAAVAAGLTGIGFGSDLGGSVRNPAHFCGLYSHKPTWGVIPFRSQTYPGAPSVPQELDMAVPGPIARDAGDLALALNVLQGPDVLNRPGWRLELPDPRMTALKGMRVALWPADPRAPVDNKISDRVRALGEQLSRAGARVSDSARPEFDVAQSWETYRALVLALTSPDHNIDHQQWLGFNLKRGQYRQRWQEFFKNWDVLITPITSTTAFEHDHSAPTARVLQVNGEARGYWEHVFWAGLATLSYLPASVFPTGLSKAGLPIGLQAIGAEFDDHTTIEFARLVGQAFGGYQPPPLFAAE